MSENIPNMPAGAVPPKKETVRITLPPKPSAAPTIKLPTLPPGGPGAAASKPGAAPAPAPAPRPQATATQAAAPRAAAPGATSAPRSATAPARTTPAGGAAQMTQTDAILCIAAAVVGLIAVGSTVYLGFIM